MKKTILVFGLVSGAVATALMLVTLPYIQSRNLGTSDFLGYSSLVLTSLLVFFGVRFYRDGAGDGQMSFGHGLAVGALISLVSSLVYAVAFEAVYFLVEPDFGEHFVACMIERAEASGAGPEEIAATADQARTLKSLYDHPLTNAALTLGTTWPLGLVVSAISAAVLRRRRRPADKENTEGASA